LAVRDILGKADWQLWGSLDRLLPLLAEAAPEEFLRAVETALEQKPCPFDMIFAQEGNGITGENYMSGLLWALEALAWDDKFLVKVCVILGELATHDPGGQWANRPANSLTNILLPWYPQTTASIEKRKASLKNLQREFPMIAWNLLLNLLPNQQQITIGTYKPAWRNTIPDNWKEGVSRQEYWEQVSFYADLAVTMATNDLNRLNNLITRLDDLPQPAFDKVLELLSSEYISSMPEDERLETWNVLLEFNLKHKSNSNTEWTLSGEIISKIESIVASLSPNNPIHLHRRLFGDRNLHFFEEFENWKEQEIKHELRRQNALKEIIAFGGADAIINFTKNVEMPSRVGYSLGYIPQAEFDSIILPSFLSSENTKFNQLASGYVWSRHKLYGWIWADNLNRSSWSATQIGQFLSFLPFTVETWNRAVSWLGDAESEYWTRTNVNPFQSNGDLGVAIEKLIKFGRPNAAIECIYKDVIEHHPIEKQKSLTALLAAISSKEPSYAMDRYHIVEIIKALQNDPDTDPNDLYQIEWAYLPLLDHHHGAFPKVLESRLSLDPDFFCEVIRLLYRSRIESKQKKNPNDTEKSIAQNAMNLLFHWRTPPGMKSDGSFSEENFTDWLKCVKDSCTQSGHLEVALTHVGHVLIYCPADTNGLWINQTVAEALNARDAEDMRNGFHCELVNSRGVHWVDPTGKPEKELAEKYRLKAEEIENAGYQRLATTLKGLAEEYDRESLRVIIEHDNNDADS
jgi:hypothetical protein